VELTGHDVNAELAGRPGFKDRAHQLWQEWLSDPTRKVMSSWPQKPQPVKAKLTPGEPLYKPKQSAKGELLPKKHKVEIKQPKQEKGKKQLSQYQEFVQKELLLGGKMKEVAAEWQTQKKASAQVPDAAASDNANVVFFSPAHKPATAPSPLQAAGALTVYQPQPQPQPQPQQQQLL
jgi:hypothetical protein